MGISLKPHPVADTLNKIGEELRVKFYERDNLIEAALLALLAKEHLFALGPPGTGKTALLNLLMRRFVGATTFEALLSRTRPDAAILGPYNLPELRDKGDFRRKTKGFLPEAQLAVLDEIGKMSPVLGHDLLAILNERVYHEVNGGRSARPVPLSTALTAANELPTNDSDDAAALWDRLLVRVVVDYLHEPGNREALLLDGVDTGAVAETTIAWEEFADAVDNVIPKIPLTRDALTTMTGLWAKLQDEGVRPSDRRYKRSVRLMQASAFLNGRCEVDVEDVAVLRFTLWDTPEQIKTVERMTLSVSNPDAEQLMTFNAMLDEINLGIDQRKGQSYHSQADYGTESNKKLKRMQTDLAKLRTKAAGENRSTTRIDQVDRRRKVVRDRVFRDLLGLVAED